MCASKAEYFIARDGVLKGGGERMTKYYGPINHT